MALSQVLLPLLPLLLAVANHVSARISTSSATGNSGGGILAKAAKASSARTLQLQGGAFTSRVYQCPESFDSPPVTIQAEEIIDDKNGDGAHARISLLLSEPGRLCTLVRVTHSSTESVGKLSNDLSGAKVALAPVGRSYDGRAWERVAGPYPRLEYQCLYASNEGDSCQVTLPLLEESDRQEYVLLTYDHELSDRNTVARFLSQTTFGTRKEDLDSWNYPSPNDQYADGHLQMTFAKWIYEQMHNVPSTSHREFFRKRLNSRFDMARSIGMPNHPCEQFSRWRNFAFTERDYGRSVEIRHVASTDKAYAIYIEGNFRTLALGSTAEALASFLHAIFTDDVRGEDDTFVDISASNGAFEASSMMAIQATANAGEGDIKDYVLTLCDVPSPIIGGEIYFQAVSGSPNCLKFGEGNIPIIVDTSIYRDPSTITVDLPPLDTVGTMKKTNEGEWMVEEALHQDSCKDINLNHLAVNHPIFGILPGDAGYLAHDPRVRLLDNSLESPIPDGGGSLVASGGSHNGHGALCSNVPRTFINEKFCQLSTVERTCTNQDMGGPAFTLRLDEESVARLSAYSKRYVYLINGLRVEQGDTLPPCKPGVKSRWMRVEKPFGELCGGDDNLDLQTQRVLGTLFDESKDIKSPHIKDIPFPEGSKDRCAERDENKIGFEVLNRDGLSCWRHVHKDHMNVYDFEYWTGAMHAGNVAREKRGEPNPIKSAFDIYGYANLTYPWHHPMNRWNEFKNGFEFIGRLSDEIDFRELPELLRSEDVTKGFGLGGEEDKNTVKNILVCGSEGEVANDPTIVGASFIPAIGDKVDAEFSNKIFYQQRASAWTTIVLSASDQLRQRMAWAIAQILVVAPITMENRKNTENFLQYYDIFIRHAFGNFRDILREVSYSPIMADFLTYLDSKSAALIWEDEGKRIYADENYARELMQLFTLGLVKLNDDGTPVLDEDGETVAAYSNEDIMSYARSWTGFERYEKRSNVENFVPGPYSNRIDPLQINPAWRDVFPKNRLGGGFIGDGYPLCEDFPSKMFLKKGARYRLLGSSRVPDFQSKPKTTVVGMDVKNIKLQPRTSQLFRELCQSSSPGNCNFVNEIILPHNLVCSNDECEIETVQVVEVIKGIFYEFIRPPCVEQPFFAGGRVIRKWNGEANVCANPSLPVAGEACCPVDGSQEPSRSCVYTGERLSFRGAAQRCSDLGMRLCDFKYTEENTDLACRDCCVEESYHWVNLPAIGGSGLSLQRRGKGRDCSIKVKVRSSDGYVAIVHDIGGTKYDHLVLSLLSAENENFFRVFWADEYPSAENQCSGGFCDQIGDICICDIAVKNDAVFSSMPTKEAIIDQLHIGSLDPEAYEAYLPNPDEESKDGVLVYHRPREGEQPGSFGIDSIFALTDDFTGEQIFFKNALSTVKIIGTSYTFRNPPHFLSLFHGEIRDAAYETEAVLESVFRNENTAPFLAMRFIQRFGLSNPSPTFVWSVAASFRSGFYNFAPTNASNDSITFGSGQYGSLAAMLPAILMHPEMRAIVLDADPSAGSLDEPILSIIRVLRSMEYTPSSGNEIVKLVQMEGRIGQMAHEPLTVFSFFLPHYHPGTGPLTSASLVSPESQLLAMSQIVSALNGLFSLTKYGLLSCGHGFGEKPSNGCSSMVEGDTSKAQGRLTYQPTSNDHSIILDELSTLLTAGRLSESNKKRIVSAYVAREKEEGKDAALRLAQQLVITSPEFRSSGVTRQVQSEKREQKTPSLTCKPYKAIVFLMLQGGVDSFNMLVPHSECKGEEDMYEQYKRVRQHLALDKDSILQIKANHDQPCDKFGVHPQLPILQQLYNEESAIFLANIGTAMPIHDNRLYGHEQMQTVCKQLDSGRNTTGTGVLGRLADILRASNVATGAASVNYISETLTGTTKSNQNMVINEKNIEKFAPKPSSGADFVPTIEMLNEASSWRSSMFAETWSSVLRESIDQNSIAYRALESAEVNVKFPSSSISKQLQTVARLISSQKCRGVERDVFYVSQGGYDHHYNVNRGLKKNFIELDEAIKAFVDEMKSQNHYDDVVLVSSSEFGRTIIPDSRGGSDHGWGGINFVVGGRVKGGRILGEYPSDLTEKSRLNLGRGRIQPTTSWEALWNGIAQWFGVTDENDLDAALPYRKHSSDKDTMYSESDLFVTSYLGDREQDQQCSRHELAQICGLEEGSNLKRARRISEEKVKDGATFSTKYTSFLVFLSLFVGTIGTALTIIFARQKK